MKRIKSNVNVNLLLQPLPETAQEKICGGGHPGGGGSGKVSFQDMHFVTGVA